MFQVTENGIGQPSLFTFFLDRFFKERHDAISYLFKLIVCQFIEGHPVLIISLGYLAEHPSCRGVAANVLNC